MNSIIQTDIKTPLLTVIGFSLLVVPLFIYQIKKQCFPFLPSPVELYISLTRTHHMPANCLLSCPHIFKVFCPIDWLWHLKCVTFSKSRQLKGPFQDAISERLHLSCSNEEIWSSSKNISLSLCFHWAKLRRDLLEIVRTPRGGGSEWTLSQRKIWLYNSLPMLLHRMGNIYIQG